MYLEDMIMYRGDFMDNKCVRILRPYCEDDNHKMLIYVEDKVRVELSCNWGG